MNEKYLIVPYMSKPDGTLRRVSGGWIHYVPESEAIRIANQMRASAVENTVYILVEQGLNRTIAQSLAPQKTGVFLVEKV